jgi:hypothetical protein
MQHESSPLTWKCQKFKELLSLWIVPLFAALKEYHQDENVAYQRLASFKDVVILYS